jgi:ATP-dependent DNA helicase PIF1
MNLTADQQEVYDAIMEGHSLFLTGPGGVGKSYLLKQVYDDYTKKTGRKIAVTALTGCAAHILGTHAKTLHSWAGIGLGKGGASALIERVKNHYPSRKKWRDIGCLIIDEVSMMTPALLDTLDLIGQAIRKNMKPFGGIQVVVVGDFYQLPPVSRDEHGDIKFAFQAAVWGRAFKRTYELRTIIRQRDPTFHKVLMEARAGELSDESYAILAARKGLSWKGQPIRPTMCFTTNANVDETNDKYLAKLTGERRVYEAKTLPSKIPAATLEKIVERMDREFPYQIRLEIAVGAQVMLTYNRDPAEGLVNGSRGVVTGFNESGWPLVKFLNGPPNPIAVEVHDWQSDDVPPVTRQQVPLKIAYAITIHKSQGSSLDCALVDIGKATFEYGQAYVALSRVRSLESLYVHDLDAGAFRVHPLVREFYSGAAVKQAEAAGLAPAAERITAYFTIPQAEPGDPQ